MLRQVGELPAQLPVLKRFPVWEGIAPEIQETRELSEIVLQSIEEQV